MEVDNKIFSFWSLLSCYDKIEIPIIQRDYAQGRENREVNKIRKDFVHYLISKIISGKIAELDFIYGVVNDNTFIPIDGQQRLTTLFLLHWYVAYKEKRLSEVTNQLSKFTYETRPSSHDFLARLCDQSFPDCEDITDYIINQAYWFNEEWLLDPSVIGMLTMLTTLQNNKPLNEALGNLLDTLISEDKLIRFYFLPLDHFGLGDELYIKMNARGKKLNEFENFKSVFYRIIKDYPDLEIIQNLKQKMEYEWVEYLWEYRDNPDKEFVTDKYFMNYLKFITCVLYHQNFSDQWTSDIDFEDFDVISKIYSKPSNLDFLIYCYDIIPTIKTMASNTLLLWQDKSSMSSISDILSHCIHGKQLDAEVLLLYATIRFLYKQESNSDGYEDFIHVVRNLITNTKDKTQRDWGKIFSSIEKLISTNVYSVISNDSLKLEGFYVPQRNEEYVKAKLIESNSDFHDIIFRCDNDSSLQGRILPLLKVTYTIEESDINSSSIQDFEFNNVQSDVLNGVYNAYSQISTNDFIDIWGDLLNTTMYTIHAGFDENTFTYYARTKYVKDYQHASSVMLFAKDFYSFGGNIDDYLDVREAKFILSIENVSEVQDMKRQMYYLYILSKQIYNYKPEEFFVNGYNLGAADYIRDYSQIFNSLNVYNITINYPCYQTFRSQFQYNRGYIEWRTPRIQRESIRDCAEKLISWAKNKV